MNRDAHSVYFFTLSDQLDRHNRAPLPATPELREVLDILIRSYEQRGCRFTYRDIPWEGKIVPGVVMEGSIVPDYAREYVLAPDNPLWEAAREQQAEN